MPLSKDDRIAFSLKIVSADGEMKAIDMAKSQILLEMDKVQKLDTGNKNLFDPVNILTNSYQLEYANLDGNQRTTIVEQDIQDSASKKLQNHFFPNDTTITVPSLAAAHNVWTKPKPFALTYAIGKNYTEGYGSVTKEPDLISACQALITSAATYTDIQNTTGQECVQTGTCSIPIHTTQATCNSNGGIWTPGPDSIQTYPDVQTLKSNLVTAINTLKTFLLAEVSNIPTSDPDTGNQALNNAAINNINNIIVPALNTWLGYVDFNTAHGQTTCAGFNAYNSNLLAPTKLHSTQLAALQSSLSTRSSFITTRLSQLSTIVGTITQDLSTGELTSSTGIYGRRYSFLVLRLDSLGGSLSKLIGMQTASGAQDSIKSGILNAKNTYFSILPTSIFKAPGNGTSTIHLVDTSFLSPGNSVYIIADNQEELLRAIKSVSGDTVVLNDIVPEKYIPSSKARLYKDLT